MRNDSNQPSRLLSKRTTPSRVARLEVDFHPFYIAEREVTGTRSVLANGDARLSSVANAVRLMKSFSDEDSELGISALAERLGLAKSSVHRLASTLVAGGMLEQNPETGRYRLGLTVFELGSLVRRKIDVYREAKPWLMTLRENTGETVHLSVLGSGAVVCINFLESKKANRITSAIGLRRPLYCTSEGKALLAFQAPAVIDRVIKEGLEPRTERTITDPATLRKVLASVQTTGFATDDEEYEHGMRSIAAPIRDDAGHAIAAVGIAAPVQRMTKKQLLALSETLCGAAQAISLRLGGHLSDA